MLRAAYIGTCLLVGLALGASNASAQVANSYVSVDSVTIGERFFLSIVAEHNFASEPLFPPPTSEPAIFGDLEIIREALREERYLGTDQPGTRIDSVVYEVATFALDTAFVPPIPVAFVSGADTLLATTLPLELPIISLVPEDAEDIRGLAPLAEFPHRLWIWILSIFLTLWVAWGVWYYFWRRGLVAAPTLIKVPEDPPDPFLIASSRLNKLEKETDLNDQLVMKPYFVELTETIRTYIGERLEIPAMETTSAELLRDLEEHVDPDVANDQMRRYLAQLLQVADLVKFADLQPIPQVAEQAMSDARIILALIEDALKPAPEEEEPVLTPEPAMADVPAAAEPGDDAAWQPRPPQQNGHDNPAL